MSEPQSLCPAKYSDLGLILRVNAENSSRECEVFLSVTRLVRAIEAAGSEYQAQQSDELFIFFSCLGGRVFGFKHEPIQVKTDSSCGENSQPSELERFGPSQASSFQW